MTQDSPFIWKSHRKHPKFGGAESQNHQGAANSVNQVDGDTDMVPAADSIRDSQKRNNGF